MKFKTNFSYDANIKSSHIQGGIFMKFRNKSSKIVSWINSHCLSVIAALALFITYSGVNTACWYVLNQDPLPHNSKKLRNF